MSFRIPCTSIQTKYGTDESINMSMPDLELYHFSDKYKERY